MRIPTLKSIYSKIKSLCQVITKQLYNVILANTSNSFTVHKTQELHVMRAINTNTFRLLCSTQHLREKSPLYRKVESIYNSISQLVC